MGTEEEGRAFIDARWPGASAIADPNKALFDAFGVERGGMAEMFGSGAIACGIRAAAKGNFIGARHSDPWTLPSFVLADGDQVTWRHDGSHAGDHPNWDAVPRAEAA